MDLVILGVVTVSTSASVSVSSPVNVTA